MESIQKVINLIKKTGDKVVILDKNDDLSCVVMTVADYEKLVLGQSGLQGLTEEELLDKINRDIAIWQDSQENGHLPIDQHDFSQDLAQNSQSARDSSFDDTPWPAVDEIDENNYFLLNSDDFKESPINELSEDEDEDRYYFESVE